MTAILAAAARATNAELIAEAHQLGYLADDWLTLDVTYGRGTFWNLYRPRRLIRNDLGKGSPDVRFDARSMPFADDTFDAVVIDFPYKLNGTPDPGVDERYGVEQVCTRDERHDLMYAGLAEGIRVTRPSGFVLFKCQDQVNSGRIWWQSRMFAEHAESLGCTHKDSLLKLGHRPQPEGRSQQHARRNYSTLLVLRTPKARPAEQLTLRGAA